MLALLPIALHAPLSRSQSEEASTGAANAQADEFSAGNETLYEIVVTAQKRAESINSVPISITAVSGAELERRGITDTNQLERVVPGFTYQQSTYGVPVFAMRGIGFFDTTLGVSPTVTVYVDQIPLPFSAMTRGAILDLERVEALKGPQGTLFGQNSTGGAINYIPARPTDELIGGFDLSYGRFNSVEANGFVSGPLSETLAARVAVRVERQDEWQRSSTRDAELGRKEFYNGRLLLDWTPVDSARFSLTVNAWQDDSDTQAVRFEGYAPLVPGYQPVIDALENYPETPRDPRAAGWDPGRDLERQDDFYLLGLRGDIDVSSSVTLTSITAYSEYETWAPSDVDGTDYTDLLITIDGKLESLSQELRLAGSAGDRLTWMIGGNYQDDFAGEYNPILSGSSVSSIGPFRFTNWFLRNEQDITTKSAFASGDLELTPTLTAQLSARYSTQDRDFAGCTQDSGDGRMAAALGFLSSLATGVPTTITPGTCVTLANDGTPQPIVRSSLDEDNVSWRTGLNWKPDSGTLVYANVSKGYKAGSFPTLAAAFASQLSPVSQESVLAYEVGSKLSLLGRSLQVNGAIFNYEYSDKQILGYAVVPGFGNLPRLVSIPESRVRGAEIDIAWQALDGLRVGAGVTYVHSKMLEDPAVPIDAFGNPTTFVGEQFPNTPQWQAVADVAYERAIGGGWVGFFDISASYRDDSSAVLGESQELRIDGYALVDVRVGIESEDEAWRLSVWGRNVTDRYYWNNAAHVGDTVTRAAGMPATYGVTVSRRFE